ncbi:MAG: prenyltransferase/squalene oxidase repeat-containing protein, partial [Candidatus Zixiibacteriota bacterium]
GKRGADAGYKLKDRRVKKILEGIIEIQREDGGFRPYWSKESDPLYTAIVLKIFLWVGAMKKKEIKSGVEKVIVNTA